MKSPAIFSLLLSGISIPLAVFTYFLFKTNDVEILAYTIGLYSINAIIGLAAFAFFGTLTREINIPVKVRLLCYFILCVMVMNCLPYYETKKIFTIELFKDIASPKADPFAISLHIIYIISFILASLICFVPRNNTKAEES
ncbi:hypothetical protein [Paraflavitalea sp. CAU 1676]|uniref:hypothetical protein n=1 Tax=Paraflavitalea sp. CAU 1676 TaxID=3032598 RepID=UPI0023DCDC1C|nr:hypothetical protein [Paraflavitalea sp. CAU 1676]MDF2192809.1 hypothetical protein [Paraflavitalea sp. CAU 1676]